jgi:methionine-rich copper-binding protein CopC
MRLVHTSAAARRGLTIAAAMFGVIVITGWRSAFHLHLLKSAPAADTTVSAAPESIRLWFSQAPELKVTTVKVTGPNSATVALAPLTGGDSAVVVVAAVKGKMAPGTYTVSWRTIANDGHIARGTFGFTVGPASR